MSDRILIRDLMLRCVIGVHEWERKNRQDVLLNLVLDVDCAAAGASDELGDALDYRALAKKVIAMVEGSSFRLVERLAEEVAAICLENDRVHAVRVRVEKPGALRFAESAGVELERRRGQR